MNKSLRIVFFGTPSFVVPVATAIHSSFTLLATVSAPDAPQGRKKSLTPSAVKSFALTNTIPAFTFNKLDSQAVQELKHLNADLFIVAAYGLIIPQQILDIPHYGSLNIHPSLLPHYRGASPIQSALLNGDHNSGVSVIKMDAEVDHGPIVAQWQIPLHANDTFASLHFSMFKDAADRLPQIIDDLINNNTPLAPQDDSQATFCERITKESGYFDIESPPSPTQLDRMIRAYFPWPNAWTRINVHGKSQVLKFFPENKIQIEGKNIVGIKEFVNGYPELRSTIFTLLGEGA